MRERNFCIELSYEIKVTGKELQAVRVNFLLLSQVLFVHQQWLFDICKSKINTRVLYFLFFMDIYFITQVFPFVHSVTSKLHRSLFADHNTQFPIIAFHHSKIIMRVQFASPSLAENSQRPPCSRSSSKLKKKRRKQFPHISGRAPTTATSRNPPNPSNPWLKLTSQYSNILKDITKPYRRSLQLIIKRSLRAFCSPN